MSLLEIAKFGTTVAEIPQVCRGVHESTLRAYHILALVKRWLKLGVPAEVILEVCEELEVGDYHGRSPEGDKQ